jgi:hypothetical protein
MKRSRVLEVVAGLLFVGALYPGVVRVQAQPPSNQVPPLAGTVAGVVKASSGDPVYIVIADQAGSDTAVPYSVERRMVHGNTIVVDDKQLQSAPKVSESQLQNSANSAWKGVAEGYWSKQAKDQG